ncbi:MAG: hypothetical protein ACYS47_13630 [Planctomycetota bacterium]|jgi:hypothetical protein
MNLLNHWLMRLEKIEERLDGADSTNAWRLLMEKRILTFLTSLYREEAANIDLSEVRRPPAKPGPTLAPIEKAKRPRTGAEISEILNRPVLRENGESLVRWLRSYTPGSELLFVAGIVLFDLAVLALIGYILFLATN